MAHFKLKKHFFFNCVNGDMVFFLLDMYKAIGLDAFCTPRDMLEYGCPFH